MSCANVFIQELPPPLNLFIAPLSRLVIVLIFFRVYIECQPQATIITNKISEQDYILYVIHKDAIL